MDEQDKGLEIRVGLFVLLGIAVIAGMTLYFGPMGEGFKSYYHLTVKLSDADGLIKGSSVMLAGSKIGFVGDKPEIQANVGAVQVPIQIYANIKIPRVKTHFQVGSSGLLGDKFVQVVMESDYDPSQFNPKDPAQYWTDGSVIEGAHSESLVELQAKGTELITKLIEALDDLKIMEARVNNDVLNKANIENLRDTFSNLKLTSSNFVDVSKNVNTLVQNAEGTVDAARQTMTTVNSAAGDLRATIADAGKLLDAAKGTLRKTTEGNGLIATLLTDRELSENIRALMLNLRTRGILFYKDTPPPRGRQQAPPAAAPASASH